MSCYWRERKVTLLRPGHQGLLLLPLLQQLLLSNRIHLHRRVGKAGADQDGQAPNKGTAAAADRRHLHGVHATTT